MQERLTPAIIERPPFRYPKRAVAPEELADPDSMRVGRLKATGYHIEMLGEERFKIKLFAGNFSCVVPFSAPIKHARKIQERIDMYLNQESPTLEEWTIVLMRWVSMLSVKEVTEGIADNGAKSGYEQAGRSAFYLHEAVIDTEQKKNHTKAGRPPQNAARLKIDVRRGSNLTTLVQSGFERFTDLRGVKTAPTFEQS